MPKLVTLLSCDDLSMAYIARSKLEAAGIPCFLANEYLAGVNRLYSPAVGGVELQVLERDVPEALALLTETSDPDLGSSPGGEAETELSPEPDTEPEQETPDACPHCGAPESEARSLGHSLLALSVFLGLPLPFRFKWRRCRHCGHKWR